MRLNFNEMRARASDFAAKWKDAHYEKGETQSFYNDLFKVFGADRKRVARYEQAVAKLDNRRGFIDLFWPRKLLVEQKSSGRDLTQAKTQAFDYLHGLKDHEQPRYILLSDFQTFELYDLETRKETRFTLQQLPDNIQALSFIAGYERREFKDQDPVNIQAAELVGRLHDALAAAGYTGHDLEQFLVRIVFCLFADDTGVFGEPDLFLNLMHERTREDGSDTGGWIAHLFQTLDTPEPQRPTNLDDDLAKFPYVNGGLFADAMRIPSFDSGMRARLIEACEFDWSPISPAIFGALFQSVMNPAERRAAGAHYTTEKNILKVLKPLFLDDLRAEFDHIKALKRGRKDRLNKLHAKIADLTFFDPACGCGNFLVIAYREIRQLEIEILRELIPRGQEDLFDVATLSRIDVDQFYGIEIGEFPARIAEGALWMMDHIMNTRLSLAFGKAYARIPLKKSPNIVHGDALEADWAAVLPPDRCSYVLGNPPFIGQSYQSPVQRDQMRRLIDPKKGKSAGSLDYVGAWFLKAGEYVKIAKTPPAIGFVSTNSITQGEQVAQLWPKLFKNYGLEISFAHRTFEWGSEARGKAHVHVVIIGLTRNDRAPERKRLFSYPNIKGEPDETSHAVLTPYLTDGGALGDPHTVVRESLTPINGLQPARMGTKPVEGGHYLFDDAQKADFLAKEPNAAQFFRPFIGSREFIQGRSRWILHLSDAAPSALATLPHVKDRIGKVRAMRKASKKKATQALGDFPTSYEVATIPDRPFLVLPKVSSERREYIPIGWLEPPVIPSDLVQVVIDADKVLFALLTSAMHNAWMRAVAGRLESRYRYSIGSVYNTFPLPDLTPAQRARLEKCADDVLAARAEHPDASLADLYDPDTMPAALRKAHKALDKAVDKLYRKDPFPGDRERVEHLFARYERLKAPVTAASAPKRRRR